MTDQFPKRAAKNAGKAYITLPVSISSTQADGTMANCRKPLHVENDAMKRIAASEGVRELDEIHLLVLYWERVGRFPELYPKRIRPRAPLNGQPLFDFIGKRSRREPLTIVVLLAEAEKILRQRVNAGLE